MIEHILTNYISSHQFGFLKNWSTIQHLIFDLSMILDSLSDKCQSDVIYWTYICKAFDSVPHISLFERVWAAGITVST